MARHAVLIGNRLFPEDEPHLRTLHCPENDVKGLSKLLESERHGSYAVTAIIDATHDSARRAIYQCLRKATSTDLVLIYYSGHGKLDEDGNLYLATKDTITDELPPTSIPVDDIRKYTRESSAASVVIILDCCFSGAVKKMFKGEVSDQASHAIGDLEGEGTFFLTASTDIQLAEEKEGDEYSLLTKYIVEGIQEGSADLNDDGIVSFQELCSFVQRKVANYGRQKPKTWYLDAAGEVTIALTGKPASDKKRRAIANKMYELATKDLLRDPVVSDVLGIINRSSSDVIASDRTVKELIDDLHAKLNDPSSFIEEVLLLRSAIRIAKSPEQVENSAKARADVQPAGGFRPPSHLNKVGIDAQSQWFTRLRHTRLGAYIPIVITGLIVAALFLLLKPYGRRLSPSESGYTDVPRAFHSVFNFSVNSFDVGADFATKSWMYGATNIGGDTSLTGSTVKITKIAVNALGENHGSGILGDLQVFVSGTTAGFYIEGQQFGTTYPEFKGQTPVRLQLTIGGYKDTKSHEYNASYDFKKNEALADPPLATNGVKFAINRDLITPSTKLMTFFNWRHIGRGVRKNSSSPPWAWPA